MWCAAWAMLVLTACTRDVGPEPAVPEVAGDCISLQLLLPQTEVRTRAQSINSREIELLWIGMFAIDVSGNNSFADVKPDARLIKTWEIINLMDEPNESKNTFNLQLSGANFYKTGNTYDPNYKYYIAAVANYRDIPARRYDPYSGFELMGWLSDMLHALPVGEATWSDFCQLAVDTRGAFETEYPVMEGGLVSANSAAAQMILPENLGFYNPAGIQRTFTANELTNLNTKNQLIVRRLISRVKVSLTTDFSQGKHNADYESVQISNIRYAAVNCPHSVWLQERIVPDADRGVDMSRVFSAEGYRTYSANYLDWQGAGRFYNIEDADLAFTAVPGTYTWNSSGGNARKTFDFEFYRYENKHTGIPGQLKAFADREAVDPDQPDRFIALSEDGVVNNFAPYFVIRADIAVLEKEKNGVRKEYDIAARYVVHEGLANTFDGTKRDKTTTINNKSDVVDDPQRLRDFSCLRNSDYTYGVTIQGVNSILVQVSLGSGTAATDGRNGSSGTVSEVCDQQAFDGLASIVGGAGQLDKSWQITLTNAQRKALANNWLFVTPYRTEIDGAWYYDCIEFGSGSIIAPSTSPVKIRGNALDPAEYADYATSQFYDWVTFYDENGKELGNIEAFANGTAAADEADDVEHTYAVRVYPYLQDCYDRAFDPASPSLMGSEQTSVLHPDVDVRALFFCIEEPTAGSDGLSSHQQIYFLTQTLLDERETLPEPSFIAEQITTPLYINQVATVAWQIDPEDEKNNADGSAALGECVKRWRISAADGTTFDQPLAQNSYTFFVPKDCIYGDNLDFSVASYPATDDDIAKYLPSAPRRVEATVYGKEYSWKMSDIDAVKELPTADHLYSDWEPLGRTLAAKGTIRQYVNGSDRAVQLGKAGKENACLKITVPESGSITVQFSNTGNSTRYLALEVDGAEAQQSKTSTASTSIVSETFNIIVDNGPKDVYIYSHEGNGGGLRIYEVAYNGGVYKPSSWIFSSSTWTAVASGGTKTVGGLTYTAGAGGSLTTNSGYVQITAGSDTESNFSFKALTSGTLTMTLSSNGSSANLTKNVSVQTGETIREAYAGWGSANKSAVSFNIEVTEPTTVCIYCASGGMRFYDMKFTGMIEE